MCISCYTRVRIFHCFISAASVICSSVLGSVYIYMVRHHTHPQRFMSTHNTRIYVIYCICLCLYSCQRSRAPLIYVHSFIHSFISSFSHLFIHICLFPTVIVSFLYFRFSFLSVYLFTYFFIQMSAHSYNS